MYIERNHNDSSGLGLVSLNKIILINVSSNSDNQVDKRNQLVLPQTLHRSGSWEVKPDALKCPTHEKKVTPVNGPQERLV